MKVLIINSDSPNNRGDRVILLGNIELIKNRWPNAEIWALSEYVERDSKWYGINFLPISAYSINPAHLIKLVRFSRNCDYIFWGGGELLKDYTNKIGLIYWLVKIFSIRIVNKNIFGMFQGIGPTKSRLGKFLIVATVNKTKSFMVRDQKSKDKLINWGAKTPVISSFDPAIVANPTKLDKDTIRQLEKSFGVDSVFLHNCVGIGVRRWFHYKQGGWMPVKFRFWQKNNNASQESKELLTYKRNFANLCDWIVDSCNLNVLFFPMHMSESENDAGFSQEIIELMRNKNKARIIDKDELSPQQYSNIVASTRLFIGARLHSTIIAASANVPALVFYYVDKGRLFFEQINMQRFSYPIETLLEKNNLNIIKNEIEYLNKNRQKIKKEMQAKLTSMQNKIYKDFKDTVTEEDSY